jgi:hypothetical protein
MNKRVRKFQRKKRENLEISFECVQICYKTKGPGLALDYGKSQSVSIYLLFPSFFWFRSE